MDTSTSLKGAIIKSDGKSASEIASIYNDYKNSKNFPAILIKLMHETPLQKGATWLLKKYIEDNSLRDKDLIQSIYKVCDTLLESESQLHILQCIPHLSISSKQKYPVAKFINKGLGSDNKFVRAWSYGAFFEQSLQHPEFEKEMIEHTNHALTNESASVKARLRQTIKKHHFWKFYFFKD